LGALRIKPGSDGWEA